MSATQIQVCPDASKLRNFVEGSLEPRDLLEVEQHLSSCLQCEDTIRGLDPNDTFDQLLANSFKRLNEATAKSDDSVVAEMIERFRGSRLEVGANDHDNLRQKSKQSERSQTLSERAAEVVLMLDPPDDPGQLGTLADYEILELVGAGSSGVVFKARDKQLQRNVALKILKPSLGKLARARFLQEARAAAAIEHENIVTIYQVGEHESMAFIAMQLLPGETLEEKLRRESTLDIEQTKSIASQIASGLRAAHEKGMIHRDIKPANIWLDSTNDRVKILDFGLARIADDDPQFTDTGMIAGTPSFMSPEQTRGADIDCRSDLFSLGCVLYQMATGRLPFEGSNALAILQSIRSHEPMPANFVSANVSSELSDLIRCLLAKSPEHRPDSATDVINAINSPRETWTFEIPEIQQVPVSKKVGRSDSGSSIGKWWILVLATILVALGGYFFGSDVIRIVTNSGELVIETDDPDVQIQISQNGNDVRVVDLKNNRSVNIKSGEYELSVIGNGDGFVVSKNTIVMTRGGKEIVTITKSGAPSESSTNAENMTTGIGFNGSLELPDHLKTEAYHEAHRLYTKSLIRFNDRQIARYELLYALAKLTEVKRDSAETLEQMTAFQTQLAGYYSDFTNDIIDARTSKVRNLIAYAEFPEFKYGNATITEGRVLIESDRIRRFNPETEFKLKSDLKRAASGTEQSKAPQLSRAWQMVVIETKLNDLRHELLQLSQQYGPSHPVMVEKKQAIEFWKKVLEQQPIYEGKPLSYWLRILKTERSFEEVQKALDASINLIDGNSGPEIAEVIPSILKRFGQVPEIEKACFRAIDQLAKQMNKTLVDIMKTSGDEGRSKAARYVINDGRPDEDFRQATKDYLAAMVDIEQSEKLNDKKWVYENIWQICERLDADLENYPDALELVKRGYENSNELGFNGTLTLMAKYFPETPEIKQTILKQYNEHRPKELFHFACALVELGAEGKDVLPVYVDFLIHYIEARQTTDRVRTAIIEHIGNTRERYCEIRDLPWPVFEVLEYMGRRKVNLRDAVTHAVSQIEEVHPEPDAEIEQEIQQTGRHPARLDFGYGGGNGSAGGGVGAIDDSDGGGNRSKKK